MNNDSPAQHPLVALLLFIGGSVRVSTIAAYLDTTEEAVLAEVASIRPALNSFGLAIIEQGGELALGTSADTAQLIEKIRRDELEGPLGKAGLETLAVIMYRGAVTRADIEYVRGVNVSTALRSLMIRGLIERIQHPQDQRTFLYQITTEVPAYFGVERIEDIPDFATKKAEIDAIYTAREATEVPE